MGLAIAIVIIALLGLLAIVTTIRRRDTGVATGGLSRETRRRDRSMDLPPDVAVPEERPPTGREVERAAAVERLERERPGELEPAAAARVPAVPIDEETLGVTRRQFLNRGIINMFLLSLGAFGAASLAFLWPSSSGGFGGKVDLPETLQGILDYFDTNKTPYYYAPGRVYVSPYPSSALPKAKKVYTGSVLAGMEKGIVALYQKCVHLGCRVPWCKSSQWFECPCHGSKYNRVGEKKGGPAPRGLDRFAVAISGSKVTVDTGLITQGPVIGTNTTGQEAEGPHCVTVGE